MKCKIRFIILIEALLLYGCKSVYNSSYQYDPLSIDGTSSDWQSVQLTEKESVFYAVTNDSANIYLMLNINDDNLQKKIFMSGLSVWIDPAGKRSNQLGIICPIKKDMGKMNRGSMQQPNEMNRFTKNPLIEAEFIGFEEKSLTCIASSNPYGIEISINSDENRHLFYELKIPLRALKKSISDFKNQQLSFEIEIDGIDMPQMGNRPDGMGAGMPGGTGGMPGGNMGTPPSGGRPGNMPGNSGMEELQYTTKFWIKNINLSQTKQTCN